MVNNDNPPPKPPQRQLRLELPPNAGTYANMAIIGHTQAEFILDFLQVLPNDPRAKVTDRVIMSPMHAKLLLMALSQNIANYEKQFGTIPLPPKPESLAEMLFKSIQPDDSNPPDEPK